MTIYLNAMEKRPVYSRISNRNYPADHGLIYYTLKLVYSFRNYHDEEALAGYKDAGWTNNHSNEELMDIYKEVKERAVLIPREEFNAETHIWNA